MKNKTKMIVALAGLVGVTGAAAGTASYAWFTTTRTATASISNIGVYGNTGNLKIQYQAIGNGLKPAAVTSINETDATSTLTFNNDGSSITPVSGNGADFYKPTWELGKEGLQAASVGRVVNNTPADQYYYVQFGLKLTNTGHAEANVYLDNGTQIKANSTGTKNTAAAKATRVAFMPSTTAFSGVDLTGQTVSKTLVSGLNEDDTAASFSYIAKPDSGDPTSYTGKKITIGAVGDTAPTGITTANNGEWFVTTYQDDETAAHYGQPESFQEVVEGAWALKTRAEANTELFGLATIDSAAILDSSVGTDIPASSLSTKPAAGAKSLICTIPPATDETHPGESYLGISIWIEGSSVNCDNGANLGSVAVDLHFAAFEA